jgi:hypothetical protein
MPFSPKGLEIEIEYKSLEPLIKEVKDVWNATQMPEGREGCDDCKIFDSWNSDWSVAILMSDDRHPCKSLVN